MDLEKNDNCIELKKNVENQALLSHQTQEHLTNCIFEFTGVLIYALCAETIKIAYLVSGNSDSARNLVIIYFFPLFLTFVYASFIPCPRLMGVHLNPAITLTLTIFGEFQVKDSLAYISSQLLGGTFGALSAHAGYLLYVGVISPQEPITNSNSISLSTLWSVGSIAGSSHKVLLHPGRNMTFTMELVFAVLLGMFVLHDAQQRGRMFLGGPGYIRWLSVSYLVSVLLFFEARMVLNSAYGIGVQFASWILQVEPLCFEWSLPLATFISLPGFIAGGAFFKLRNSAKLSSPDPIEQCIRGSEVLSNVDKSHDCMYIEIANNS